MTEAVSFIDGLGSSRIDDVGWTDGGSSDRVYASAFLTQSGTPDAATRIFGDDLSASTGSWFNGDISASVDYSQGSFNLPANAVITPGNYNFGATAPALDAIDVNAGQTQRSTVDSLQITFDGLVDFDSDAFTVIQRSDSDGTATGGPKVRPFAIESRRNYGSWRSLLRFEPRMDPDKH